LIPHNFGIENAPLIDSVEMLREKMTLLEALADIAIAANLIKKPIGDDDGIPKHPTDTIRKT